MGVDRNVAGHFCWKNELIGGRQSVLQIKHPEVRFGCGNAEKVYPDIALALDWADSVLNLHLLGDYRLNCAFDLLPATGRTVKIYGLNSRDGLRIVAALGWIILSCFGGNCSCVQKRAGRRQHVKDNLDWCRIRVEHYLACDRDWRSTNLAAVNTLSF